MSKSTAESPAPVASDINYQPLSKLAIIGLGCAGVYVLIVVVSAVVAFFQSTPPFLPIGILLLPLIGAALCLLAQRKIRNSEGTLGGENLTQIGLWLSVIGGLGYGAFYLATGMAVQQQADQFLMVKDESSGFFPYLLEGDANRAFLLTLPWQQRKNVSPDNPESMQRFRIPENDKQLTGPLGQFLDNQVVQLIMQAGREGKNIQSLGAKLWKFEKGEYYVERNYRIETTELTLDVVIPVKTNDTETPEEERKWTVVWEGARRIQNPELTPFGLAIQRLRGGAYKRFSDWAQALQNGTLEKFQAKDRTNWNSLDYPEGLIRTEMNNELKRLFSGEDMKPREIRPSNSEYIPWKKENGRMQFIFTMYIQVPRLPTGTQYLAETRVVVESTEPVNPMEQSDAVEWEVKSVQVLEYTAVPSPPAS